MRTSINWVIVVIAALLAGGIGYWVGGTKNSGNQPNLPKDAVICTLDAKICPDGSSVGRVAPNCEFEACPSPAL